MTERARTYCTIAAATLLAALAPAFVVAGLGRSLQLMPLMLSFTLVHTIVLGLPSFFAIDANRPVNVVTAMKTGAAIGAIPLGLFGLMSIANGGRWVGYFGFVATLGALGALGGLVFWLTLKLCGWRGNAEDTGAAAAEPNDLVTSIGALVVALLLAGGTFAIPDIAKDRTCHNVFRDGRTSINPQVNMYLEIEMDDWPKLARMFERFATTHGMSVRNASRDDLSALRVLSLSLCNERG